MKNNESALRKVKEGVFDLFKNSDQNQLVFHNYSHTAEVVEAVIEIGKAIGISKKDMEVLQIAAWFHDTGHLFSQEDHEEISVKIAREFLQSIQYDQKKIESVCSVILATKYPHNKPIGILGEVICDADLLHLGKKEYLQKAQLLNIEQEFIHGHQENINWYDAEMDFLSKHKYLTEYAQRTFANGKAKNILLLRQFKLKSRKSEEKEQKEIVKSQTPERGIETMFRISFRNHVSFSSIADSKANIMLSINAIIISIALSTLIPNFDDSPALIIPTCAVNRLYSDDNFCNIIDQAKNL